MQRRYSQPRAISAFLQRVALPLATLLFAGVAFAAGTSPEPSALVSPEFRAELERTLNAWVSMEARFEQQVLDSGGALLETSSGTVAVSRPGRFRWQYELPYRQLIVSDGMEMLIYDEDLSQVSVGTLDAARDDPGARLLNERVDLDELFFLTRLPDADGLSWARLVPRAEGATYRQVEVGMRNGALEAIRLDDQFGQTTRLEFFDVRREVSFESGRFTFAVPEGVDVVRMNE